MDKEDPNFRTYADGVEDDSQPIHYYRIQAEKLKSDEKVTMFIDYSHIARFHFNEPTFNELIVTEYLRYEPYLMKALTTFMNENQKEYAKERFF